MPAQDGPRGGGVTAALMLVVEAEQSVACGAGEVVFDAAEERAQRRVGPAGFGELGEQFGGRGRFVVGEGDPQVVACTDAELDGGGFVHAGLERRHRGQPGVVRVAGRGGPRCWYEHVHPYR